MPSSGGSKPSSSLKLNPQTIKTSEEQSAGGQVMPAAAFVDRKKVEEEKAQAEQAQQAADVAAEDAKAEAERGIREWLLEVLHDPRKIVKLIKRYRWASIMAAAAMSMALIFYLVVLPIYYSYLFNAGERALANREYSNGIDYMNRYLAIRSDDAEAILLLAQAHLFSKRLGDAERILTKAEGNEEITQKIKFWYYRAGLYLLSNPKKPNLYINKALDIDPEHVPTLLVRGLDSIAKRDWQKAQNKLSELLLIVEGSDYQKEDDKMDVGFWMSYYFDNKLLPAISFIAELPFSKLKGKPPIADNLGFNIDPSGFQNLYYVPYDSNFLTDMDIPDAVSFLLLIAYIIDEKELEAKSLLDISGGKNVWEKYYSAYLDVKTEDYAAATALYNEIVAENLSSDSSVMLANALWASSQGEKPTGELLALYASAYDSDKKNILAVNNLAFMKIYTDDEDEALSLLKESAEAAENNSYIAINIALLELSSGDFKVARPKVYALLETAPKSLLLLNAALLIERELGNYQAAIDIANVIKKISPDSERIYLDVAGIYRQDGNHLLELAELKKGHKAHPLNANIVAELALSYIQNRQYKKAEQVLQYAIINIGDDYRVLWAQGKLHARADVKAAEDFFRQAAAKAPISKKADVVFSLGRFYLNIAKKPEKALALVSGLVRGYNERQNFNLLALRLRANALLNIDNVSEGEVKQAMLTMAEENVSVPARIDIAWVFLFAG